MSPQKKELKKLAEEYCLLVESCDGEKFDWLQQVSGLLVQIHAAVSAMEHAVADDDHRFIIDLDARFELYTHLKELLGERDAYWMKYDATGDNTHMSGSLADDLTDIYCELKSGLRLVEGAPEMAIEGWRKGYLLHWGQHLTDAQRHLYELSVSNKLVMSGE